MEGGGEHRSHLAQNQDTKNKINQSSTGCEEEKKSLIAYTPKLGILLVNKNWNGSFMSMNLSSLVLLRLDRVIA